MHKCENKQDIFIYSCSSYWCWTTSCGLQRWVLSIAAGSTVPFCWNRHTSCIFVWIDRFCIYFTWGGIALLIKRCSECVTVLMLKKAKMVQSFHDKYVNLNMFLRQKHSIYGFLVLRGSRTKEPRRFWTVNPINVHSSATNSWMGQSNSDYKWDSVTMTVERCKQGFFPWSL